jgi:uncharacterized membrane protein
MRIKSGNELLVINILAALLVIIIMVFPGSALRAVLGFPFVLFFPGYTLLAAISPAKNHLGGMPRIALSFGISVSVVILIGVILNYSTWGFSLNPLFITLFIFILIASVAGWLRRKQVDITERFAIDINLSMPSINLPRGRDRIILVIIALALIGAIGTIGYVIAMPKTGLSFTRLQLLDLDGTTDRYPEKIVLGQEASVQVIIDSYERSPMSYQLKVVIDGVQDSEYSPIELDSGQSWQQTIGFTPSQVGNNQKVEFMLFEGDGIEPYLTPLHLWIDVE